MKTLSGLLITIGGIFMVSVGLNITAAISLEVAFGVGLSISGALAVVGGLKTVGLK